MSKLLLSKSEIAARKAQSERDKLAAASQSAAAKAQAKRAPMSIGGKGDYKLKTINGVPIGRAVGAAAGGVFGPTGAIVGGALGHAAHYLSKRIFGWGDYSTDMTPKERGLKFRDQHRAHLSAGRSLLVGGNLPLMSSDGRKTFVVTFEEMIGSVIGSTEYKCTSYRGNVGCSSTFPYASGVARNFTQYRMMGAVAHIKPLVSDNSASSGVLGEIGIGTRYSVNKPPPESFNEFSLGQYNQTDVATSPVVGIIECDPSRLEGTPWKDVLNDGQPGVGNQDHFQLDVCTQGFSTPGQRVGELWITYHFAVNLPCFNVSATARSMTFESGQLQSLTVGATCAMPVGLKPVTGSTLNGTFLATNGLSLGKLPGNYFICVYATSTAALSGTCGMTLGADAIGVNYSGYYSGTSNTSWVPTLGGSAVGGNHAMCHGVIKYTAASVGQVPDITFNLPTVAQNAWYRVFITITSRETGYLSYVRDNGKLELMEVLYSQGLVARPEPSVGNIVEDLVCRYSTVDGFSNVESWPYTGPVPPPEYLSDEADDDSTRFEHVSASAAASKPSVATVRDPSPEDLRAAGDAARELIAAAKSGSPTGYTLSAIQQYLQSPRHTSP